MNHFPCRDRACQSVLLCFSGVGGVPNMCALLRGGWTSVSQWKWLREVEIAHRWANPSGQLMDLGQEEGLNRGNVASLPQRGGGNVRLVFKQIWNSRQNWCNKAASKRYKVWAFLQNLGPTEIWELKSSSLIKRFAKAQKTKQVKELGYV